jgi:hypothetical protein
MEFDKKLLANTWAILGGHWAFFHRNILSTLTLSNVYRFWRSITFVTLVAPAF